MVSEPRSPLCTGVQLAHASYGTNANGSGARSGAHSNSVGVRNDLACTEAVEQAAKRSKSQHTTPRRGSEHPDFVATLA
jgi:hypothetical protein